MGLVVAETAITAPPELEPEEATDVGVKLDFVGGLLPAD
jgi:hypothetical protein